MSLIGRDHPGLAISQSPDPSRVHTNFSAQLSQSIMKFSPWTKTPFTRPPIRVSPELAVQQALFQIGKSYDPTSTRFITIGLHSQSILWGVSFAQVNTGTSESAAEEKHPLRAQLSAKPRFTYAPRAPPARSSRLRQRLRPPPLRWENAHYPRPSGSSETASPPTNSPKQAFWRYVNLNG